MPVTPEYQQPIPKVYTRKQIRNDDGMAKEMPRDVKPIERAISPDMVRGESPLHPQLKDSNYEHNKGVRFENITDNAAWHKMGDEPTVKAMESGSIPDPAKV